MERFGVWEFCGEEGSELGLDSGAGRGVSIYFYY